MKTTLNLALPISVFGFALASTANCFAQTQTITLAASSTNMVSTVYPNFFSTSYAVTTNQIVQIATIAGFATITFYHSSGVSFTTTNSGGIFTGLTNIVVVGGNSYSGVTGIFHSGYYPALVTLTITTPSNPALNVVSNYVPADAIVIPASANGNVQIILESSPDLVNWTAANPGTYGASAGATRFFRVHAVAIP